MLDLLNLTVNFILLYFAFNSVLNQFINKSGHPKRNAFTISKHKTFSANNTIISIGEHFDFINHYKEDGQKLNIPQNKQP